MTPEQKSWKPRLRALGLSQNAFARKCRLSYSQMCEYLNCKREPMATRFKMIERKLIELETPPTTAERQKERLICH